MGRDCAKEGCIGCLYSWCKCNYACLKCNLSRTAHCGYPEEPNKLLERYRQKWLCLDCRYIWSSKYTKWLEIRDEKNYKEISKKQNKSKIGKCHKCKKDGIKLGNKFRMPPKNKNKVKTNKFWKDLQKRFDETGYVHEFDDYCPNDRYFYSNKKNKENKFVLNEDDYPHKKIFRFYATFEQNYFESIDFVKPWECKRWIEYENKNKLIKKLKNKKIN